MWTETTTFDVYNATKNYNKILDLGPNKGSGVGYNKGIAWIKQFKYHVPHSAH